ncbi:hypothetical protein KY289_026413 [Solanum tuberosum]|nr:hypothetical protein KY289_026413 [Solanum tuberosum]
MENFQKTSPNCPKFELKFKAYTLTSSSYLGKTTNEDLELTLEVGIKQLKYACKILELHLKYHVPEAYKVRGSTLLVEAADQKNKFETKWITLLWVNM